MIILAGGKYSMKECMKERTRAWKLTLHVLQAEEFGGRVLTNHGIQHGSQ